MIANELPTSQRLFIAMNKLLLTSILLISVGSLCGMDSTSLYELRRTGKETQPTPMTLAQLYYQFSHKLLLPEITQEIFSLQCGDYNLAKMEQSRIHLKHLVPYIGTLISSCGYLLTTELCDCFFKHKKISICDIQSCGGENCLHYSTDPKTTLLLIQIAGNNAWKLLSMQDNFSSTALLHHVTDTKNIEVVKLLLDAAGEKAQDLICIPCGGETALDIASPEIKALMQTYMTNNESM